MPTLAMTRDPDLHLWSMASGSMPLSGTTSSYVFRLGAKPRAIRLRSRSAVPQELGVARDPRPLGVAVRRIVLAQARRQRAVEADAASLVDGYHAFEPDNGIRWTDGDAAVPPELFAGMSGARDADPPSWRSNPISRARRRPRSGLKYHVKPSVERVVRQFEFSSAIAARFALVI